MGDDLHHRRRRDLLARGITPTEIRAAIRRGELDVVGRGAYVAADGYQELDPDDRHRVRVRAAADRAPRHIVSHASAAALHRLPLYGVDLSRVHLTRPGHGGNRRTATRWVHAGEIGAEFVVRIDGIVTTTVARTLVDLGRTESTESAVVAADSAAHTGAVTLDEVARALAAAKRHAGRPRAERALALVDGRAESPGESRLRLLLNTLPLPAPALQVTVFDERGDFLGRADAGYLEHGVLIEFDGFVKYGRLLRPGQTATDVILAEKRREERLTELGWLVLRLTWDDLRRPRLVTDRIVRACTARHAWAGAIRGSTRAPRPIRLI